MPDVGGKKRTSPIINHKTSRNSDSADVKLEQQSDEESPVETTNDVVDVYECVPQQQQQIIDEMKTNPSLHGLIVESYEGPFDEAGFYEGEGKAIFSGGRTYSGTFKRGKMHGYGVYEWKDGTIYSGNFKYDQICGQGIYTWKDGSCYEGDVENGMRHGYGTYQSADKKSSYSGQWENSKRHGKGISYFDESGLSFYDGDWLDGIKCGYGVRRFANGNIYEGYWQNNMRHGEGTMYWHDLGQEYSGHWEDGVQEGFGKSTWYLKRVCKSQYPLRNHYVGEFKSGMRHGYGTFYYANSAVYEGEWRRNQKHGEGMFTFKNGSIFKGKFLQDKMIDFPNLILSGMNTPDIIQHQIPVKNSISSTGCDTRPVSMLESSSSALETSIDPFLDVDVNDILMDLKCNIDIHEIEAQNVLNIFLRFATNLKHVYKFYSSLGLEFSVDNTFVMEKLQFWRFLLDFKLHTFKNNNGIVEIERYLNEPLNLQNCHKKVFFRDFLSHLIKISYFIFGEDFSNETYVISKSLEKLVTLICDRQHITVGGCLYRDLQRTKEMLPILDDLLDIYFYFCDYFTMATYNSVPNRPKSPIKFIQIIRIYKQLGLITETFRGKDLIGLLTKEMKCHAQDDDEDDFDLEKETSPLEFVEIIYGTATLFITKDIMERHHKEQQYIDTLPVFELSPSKSDHGDIKDVDENLPTSEENDNTNKSSPGDDDVIIVNEQSETSPSKSGASTNQKAATAKSNKKKEQKKLEKENSGLLNTSRSREKKVEKKRSSLKNEEVMKNKSPSKKEGVDSVVPKVSSVQSEFSVSEPIIEDDATLQEKYDEMKEEQSDDIRDLTTRDDVRHDARRSTSHQIVDVEENFDVWKMKFDIFFNKYFFPAVNKRKDIDKFKILKTLPSTL